MAGGLVLQQLLYADEVRPIDEIEVAEGTVKDTELNLAVQLIEQISSDQFDPTAYQDDVKKRIEEAVAKKVEGEEIAVSPSAPDAGGAQVIDLMEALRASLGKAAPLGKSATAAKTTRKPPKRADAPAPAQRAKGGGKK